MKRDVVEVIFSLMPYTQGVVELAEIADVAAPIALSSSTSNTATCCSQGLLIACVDDSLWFVKVWKDFKTGGYQFLAVQDSLRASQLY